MASTAEETTSHFQQEDHQGAYIFTPQAGLRLQAGRPAKRRRTSDKSRPPGEGEDAVELPVEQSLFVPLLDGAESSECVQLREKLYKQSWAQAESQIQAILRDVNSATLDEVTAFVHDEASRIEQIPSAFIITGANIASQDLLFQQLAEQLQAGPRSSKFIRLKSSETTNVKAVLKKIISDATTSGEAEGEDAELSFGQDGRKYLNYDLDGLHAFVRARSCEHVFVAFEDSEGFDSALLSDLIVLFHSWLPKIPFTLLFGVATSVELLQARLLKSTCQLIYGAQFNVAQAETIIDKILKPAVMGINANVRVGSTLLKSIIERQTNQVTSIQTFISSLKYAYMCHFYSNPLSIFGTDDDTLNSELVSKAHLEAIRLLPSFRMFVETWLAEGRLDHAKAALEDDEFLMEQIFEIPKERQRWALGILRSMAVLEVIKPTGVTEDVNPASLSFREMYFRCLECGPDPAEDHLCVCTTVCQMQSEDFASMLQGVLDTMTNGHEQLGIAGWRDATKLAQKVYVSLRSRLEETRALLAVAREKGNTLRNKYNGHSTILRTTVVAQKVQLSHDSAALSDEDNAFTETVDAVVELLFKILDTGPAEAMFLHETWYYDNRTPYRQVFNPRPRTVLERSLLRPQDYLACTCCMTSSAEEGGISTTMPVTALLYHLYLEAGSIINVADLWAAFCAMVGKGEDDGDEAGRDERTALVLFYRALAELRALGFVKSSRKKVDHIAKLKWL